MVEVIYTDLYPTRYTAFKNPGKVVIFQPREDGMFRHCREDAPYQPTKHLSAPLAETACYLSVNGKWGDVRPAGRSGYVARMTTDEPMPVLYFDQRAVQFEEMSTTCQDAESAIAKLVEFVNLNRSAGSTADK